MEKIKNILSTSLIGLLLVLSHSVLATTNCDDGGHDVKNCHTSPSVTGSKLFDIRDFREVMPGVLYRGGATYQGEQRGLNDKQRKTLCEAGIGASFYLYKRPIDTTDHVSCSDGKTMSYAASDYVGGAKKVNQRVYESIHNNTPATRLLNTGRLELNQQFNTRKSCSKFVTFKETQA